MEHYSQLESYKEYKIKDGYEIVEVNSGNEQINFIKTRKKIGCFYVPFVYKLEGVIPLIDDQSDLNLARFIDKELKNIFCLKLFLKGIPGVSYCNELLFNSKKFTYLLDLSTIDDEEQYLSVLKSKVRTKIRKSLKQGFHLEEVNDYESLEKYIELRNKNREMNGLKPVAREHYINTWETIGKAGTWRAFLAYKDEVVLSGQSITISNDRFELAGVCTSPEAYKYKLNANDYMQWEIVRLAIQSKIRFVDWCGAQPNSTDPKMNAIDAFKAKWGGELVEYPVVIKGY